MKNKYHIAMWSCPRSRSTLMTRSFEQRNDCIILDEPFYPAYLLTHGLTHPSRKEIIAEKETNYKIVIDTITKDIPSNKVFSFQKHIAKNILPEFGDAWLSNLTSFFLIRHPREVIASYLKINNSANMHDIGFVELNNIFNKVKNITGKTPIVIDSDDLLSNPQELLTKLCKLLNIEFTKDMLSWSQGVKDSKILMGGKLEEYAGSWQSSLITSTGFQKNEKKEIVLPKEYLKLEEECLSIYNELYAIRLT